MAYSLSSSETGTLAPTDDLVVILNPHNRDLAEFLGSRALLEAEGLIPEGTDWPQAYRDLSWQAGDFKYWLRRERPDGAKGPRRAFADVDWFSLRRAPLYGPSYDEREIAIKAKELNDMVYRLSARGKAERSAQFNRYWATMKDAAFQAFKATIPGLTPRKRGRSRKVSAEEQST